MSFLEAIINFIQSADIATFGTNMFEGDFPTHAPETCLIVLQGVGEAPDCYLPIRDPSIQFITRGPVFPDAYELMDKVFTLFHGDPPPKHNYQVGDFYVLCSRAYQEPGDIGRDEAGRKMLSCNFGFKIRGG